MKRINSFFALAAMVLLAGCTAGPVDMLNRAQPVGSPFTKYLAHEYAVYANTTSWYQSTDKHFAEKGLAAVDGMIVEPEKLDNSSFFGGATDEMIEARGQLMAALSNGGRDHAPDDAAIAQTRFDCWVARDGTFPGDDVSCKDKFIAALAALQQGDSVAPPPSLPSPPAAPEGAPASTYSGFPAPIGSGSDVRGANVPVGQASLLVFFDWDKHNISGSAGGVIDTMAQEIKRRSDINQVVVTGYTDTSGGEAYNQTLSMKRANATREALVSRGIPASKIRVEGRGETALLVQTPDGVREPQNRRAQITFE